MVKIGNIYSYGKVNFVGDIRETHAGLPTFEQHTQGHGEMEITEEGWDRNVRTLNYVSFLHKRVLFFLLCNHSYPF